uniref:H-NS histone family protein n=1 Tax=uncultured Acinetobacter sp. TaxID=165433 RepID=UPI00262F8FC1|nr:H-NS histone family protein [uncultured Acinetobacter sp.]
MGTNIDNLDLNQFNPNQLKELTEKAQQLIEQKNKEKIDQAYAQLVDVAKSVGLTLDELLAHGQKKKSKPTRKVAPRYRNPKDASQTWTGRGKQPRWVVDALAKGKKLDDLAI